METGRVQSAREHSQETGHSVIETLSEPWKCKDCPARSAAYDLTVKGRTPSTSTTEESSMTDATNMAEIDMHDVTVRIPVHMTAAATAGFIERAVTNAMRDNDWSGSAFVIFRQGDRFVSFLDGEGFTDPYAGTLPHA
ncbi:MAG: hypothetical protein ACXVYY_01325 [Oryzihumus sp.]